jgi:poly(A) polymerase
VIQEELERGMNLTDDMVMGKRPWKDLFAKHTFFTRDFKYYLTITSISKNKESHKAWSGFVESRSRHLAMDVENHPSIAIARPYVKAYDRVHRCKNPAEVQAVENNSLALMLTEAELAELKKAEEAKALEVKSEQGVNGEQTTPENGTDGGVDGAKAENGATPEDDGEGGPKTMLVYTTTQFLGLQLGEKVTSIDLANQCNRFTKDCLNWENCDSESNTIRIHHIKASMLPDDVFEAGEVKPVKMVKKKRPAADDGKPKPAKRQQMAAAPAG